MQARIFADEPRQGAKEVRGKGGEPNLMSEANDEQEQEQRGGWGKPQRERRAGSITPLGRSHQGGGEEVVVDPTLISLVLRFQSPEV